MTDSKFTLPWWAHSVVSTVLLGYITAFSTCKYNELSYETANWCAIAWACACVGVHRICLLGRKFGP